MFCFADKYNLTFFLNFVFRISWEYEERRKYTRFHLVMVFENRNELFSLDFNQNETFSKKFMSEIFK